MSITISSDDPRSIKAIEIAAGAAQWLRCRTAAGDLAFGVPSQCERKPGVYYIVTAQWCDCHDFQHHGQAGLHSPCKHVLAVRLHDELVRAQRSRSKRGCGHPAVARPKGGEPTA
jgi:hypothetical protein